MRNREQIYGQEAAELLRNITVYHCMRRDQLLRLYPGKESVIENLLRYLVKQQRIFYNTDRDCYGDVPDCREDRELTAALLGHAQASTTLNLYGHVLPDHKKISMEKMRGNYMSCSMSGSSDDTSADAPQTQDPTISTIEDARHNQEPTISIAAEDIQGLELSGDTNAAMPQIRDLAIDTNANEKQAQAS